MSRLSAMVVLLMATSVGGLSWLLAADGPQLQTSYWRQNRFIIPMNRPRGNPREVQLLVSRDGEEWAVKSTISYVSGERAPQEHFQFRAPEDGVYWFSAHTVFAQQTPRRGKPAPHLKVIVDTRQPQLDFDAFVGGAGEIVIQWRIADANLDPRTMLVEYQAEGDQQWRKVAVDPGQADSRQADPKQADAENAIRGQSSWFPRVNARTVNVRAEIQDKAANRTVASRRLVLPKIAQDERRQFRDLAAGELLQPSPGSQQWTERAPRSPGDRAAQQQPVPDSQRAADADPTAPAVDDRWQARRLAAPPAVTSDIQPQVAEQRRDAANGSSNPRQGPIDYRTPSGTLPTMTRATRFELDYDVHSVAAHQLEKVELWRTTDGGVNWSLWREDPDLSRPVMTVEVEGEGVYGFRTVIVANTGLASRQPRSGEEADLWIGVDTTPPQTQIVSTAYGQGSQAGKLVVEWQVSDDALADRPIALSFSATPDGPWTTIVSGIADGGRYVWNPGSRTPSRIYLRLEARDVAGNVGSHQTTDPIRLDGLSPSGRIRGFRPAP